MSCCYIWLGELEFCVASWNHLPSLLLPEISSDFGFRSDRYGLPNTAFPTEQWRSISKWKQNSFPGATTEMPLSSSWPKIKSGPEHLRWTRRINIPNDPRSGDLFLASGIFGMHRCFTGLHEQFTYKCLLSTKVLTSIWVLGKTDSRHTEDPYEKD